MAVKKQPCKRLNHRVLGVWCIFLHFQSPMNFDLIRDTQSQYFCKKYLF